jgi:hypothetical protein
MNCRSCLITALLGCFSLAAIAGDKEVVTEAAVDPEAASAPISEPAGLPFSGEFLIEQTLVGGGDVNSGSQVVSDFNESDTEVRFVFTPRIKVGILRLGAEYERFSFDFPDNAPLPDTLQSVSLVLGLDTQLSDSILVRFEAQPGMYNTGFGNLSDDFNMPFIIGGTYIYSPNLQFIAGVSVDVERKYPILPAAGVRWKIARQWVLNGVLPAPRIEFEPTKALTLYVGADITQTSFRVDDNFGTNQGNPRLDHAVLTYSEVRTGVGLDWKIASFLTLTAETGYQPYRSFDLHRADVEFDQTGGAAPYGMVSLHGAF